MKATPYMRLVTRDGVDVLQQWWAAEGWEHEAYVKNGGTWQDVERDSESNNTRPWQLED